MKKILICLCLLFSCCFGAEWFEIDNKTYLDLNSIKLKTSSVVFWLKSLNNKDIPDFDGKKVWYVMNKNEIDCYDNKIKSLAFYVYDLQGKQINGTDEADKFSEIIPGTKAEEWKELLCTYKKNQQVSYPRLKSNY